MKKIIIFNGSPRKHGGVSQILNRLQDGANEAGAQVKVYDLNQAAIKGCQGCMYCKTKKVAKCCLNDYLQPMYEDIQAADVIVVGSPIYMFHVSAQVQTWINRLFPFVDLQHNPLAGGKKLITVYSQGSGSPNAFKSAMDYFEGIMKIMDWKEVERIINTDCLPAVLPAKVSEEILNKAYEIGKFINDR